MRRYRTSRRNRVVADKGIEQRPGGNCERTAGRRGLTSNIWSTTKTSMTTIMTTTEGLEALRCACRLGGEAVASGSSSSRRLCCASLTGPEPESHSAEVGRRNVRRKRLDGTFRGSKLGAGQNGKFDPSSCSERNRAGGADPGDDRPSDDSASRSKARAQSRCRLREQREAKVAPPTTRHGTGEPSHG